MKMIEGLKKSMWKSSSSSSTRLLWIMAPLLILVSLVVTLGSSKTSSTWVFADSYYPWSWGPFLGKDQIPVSPPPANHSSTEPPSTFPSRVAADGGGGKRLDLVFDAYNSSNNSTASPLDFESQEIQQPDIQEEEELNISSSRPTVISSSNETKTPLQVTIQRKFKNLERLEANLGKARAAIRAALHGNQTDDDPDYVPTGPVYWNANVFHRSYLEMERQFKIFVYEEGEPPVFHNGPCKSIYASEGNFIYHMETSPFRTRDPEKAHVYFLPISVTAIVHFVYDRSDHSKEHWIPMKQTVSDYINLVAGKYPYWNRSLGADHFMLACHDWDTFEEKRSILEPAGALSLAGAEAYCKHYNLKDQNIVVIASGANMNFDRLRLVTELADVGRQREAVLATNLPEEQGSFKKFVELVGPMNITEFRYRYNSDKGQTLVLYSVGLHTKMELDAMLQRMTLSQLHTIDLTDNDLVKDHLRHLIGGRSSVQDELLCRFVFPERPGALMKFLDAFSPRWNISLFHYRSQGEAGANVLVGLQVASNEIDEFKQHANNLGFEYAVETFNEAFQLLMH